MSFSHLVLILFIGLLPLYFNAQTITDMDNDGMDDQWELENGLSMSDAKDAWLDDDGDEVLNLFEFQLGGDPFDSSIPTQITVFPGKT